MTSRRLACSRLLISAVALSPSLACGQRQATDIRLKPIVAFEERQKLLLLREQLRKESAVHEERRDEVSGVAERLSKAAKTSDHEQQLLRLMQVARLTGEVADRCSVDRLRTLDLADRIKTAVRKKTDSTDEGEGEDEVTVGLRETDAQMRAILDDQVKFQRRLKQLRSTAGELAQRIPTPSRFRELSGVAMVLVGSGKNAVYMSQSAITQSEFTAFLNDTGHEAGKDGTEAESAPAAVSWNMATQFCQWLTSRNRARFRLPTDDELNAFTQQSDLALWTSSEWKGPTPAERNVRLRFGVEMHSIWDPSRVLGAESILGEVPFASHPQLVFRVVTSLSTGKRDRWNRLRKKLKQH